MSYSFITIAVATLAASLASMTAFAGVEETPRAVAQVTFNHAERFTDFRMTGTYNEADSANLQKELTKAVRSCVAEKFPRGYTFVIRFDDIDLAGLIRRYHDLAANEARTYDRGFPPRLKFDYTVLDPEGKPAMSGPQELVDRGYDQDMRSGELEYTCFESRMLREFVRGIGRQLAKAKKP